MKKWGILCMTASIVTFLLIVLVPFLNLPAGYKTAALIGLAILGELLFWIGGIMLGKELFTKFRHRLNPLHWGRKKEKPRSGGEGSPE